MELDVREHAFLLDHDGRVAEARGEFERIDALAVDDAVQVDIADIALAGQQRLHQLKR